MTTETRLHLSSVPTLQTYEFSIKEIENEVPTGVCFYVTVVRYCETTGCDVKVRRINKGRETSRTYHYPQAPKDWKTTEKIALKAVETLYKWGNKE